MSCADVKHCLGRRFSTVATIITMVLCAAGPSMAGCVAEQPTPQTPNDLAFCASLEAVVRKPGATPLHIYEDKLGQYLRAYCHRNRGAGWRSDKRVRDTGPFIAERLGTSSSGKAFGTHAPVLVWYSPEMLGWLKAVRGNGVSAAAEEPPIPDGAMMIKEMYPAPASVCAGVDSSKLLPTSGAAVMVRDNATARDGWFWGWIGWQNSTLDWPAPAVSPYPNMGFGQYCVNCHASAHANQTFASLRNLEGEPGEPLVYLAQHTAPADPREEHHEAVASAVEPTPPATTSGGDGSFMVSLGLANMAVPKLVEIQAMPPATYDNVWARPKGHGSHDFVTSDQCLGCHDAGTTGLQFDMTERTPDGLVNISPYGTWRTSPMGMAGRDPIFFAQLASETEGFHPLSATLIEDTCLGCHGVLGQRALQVEAGKRNDAPVCRPMVRAMVSATPFPDESDPFVALADYAALARDGVSCVACHRMALGREATAKVHGEPQNACLDKRRALLTPGLGGLAASFTGSFDVGPEDRLNGPFDRPLEMPMKHALGMRPVHDTTIRSSELCASCHVVHLPVLKDGAVIGHTYEQTTYAEWAFSAYRTGTSPDGVLPAGAGAQAQSCQDCHMSGHDRGSATAASKIASIQEYSTFPQTENNLGPAELDLPTRSPYAKHTLVGLNTILVKLAGQFPNLLGIRTQDPMLTTKAIDPLITTERAMLDQAAGGTATIALRDLSIVDGALDGVVTVTNRTGHKFPSGVGFRRAFITFIVRDGHRKTLWVSGQTNTAGVILDGKGKPLEGEYWWTADCARRIDPMGQRHQPHHEVITRQDEVQIYEDVAAGPATDPVAGTRALCTKDVGSSGPLTTSFLSRCTKVKDNRLLPAGFLDLKQRVRVAAALGAGSDLAEEAGAFGVGTDPDYREGGSDSLRYHVPLSSLTGTPASVEAELFYQATPPYYLQDRACTSAGADTKRLMFMAAHLDLEGSRSASWKLRIATSGSTRLEHPATTGR